jgi:hypothetical protein
MSPVLEKMATAIIPKPLWDVNPKVKHRKFSEQSQAPCSPSGHSEIIQEAQPFSKRRKLDQKLQSYLKMTRGTTLTLWRAQQLAPAHPPLCRISKLVAWEELDQQIILLLECKLDVRE